MISISDVIKTLSPNQKAILDYAHEHGISQFIEFSPGKFVGVDAERIPYLGINQSAGRWSIGVIKGVIPRKAGGSSS